MNNQNNTKKHFKIKSMKSNNKTKRKWKIITKNKRKKKKKERVNKCMVKVDQNN